MQEKMAFTRRDLIEVLGLSLRSIDTLLARGELRGRRVGRRILIPKKAIEEFLQRDHRTSDTTSTDSAAAEARRD